MTATVGLLWDFSLAPDGCRFPLPPRMAWSGMTSSNMGEPRQHTGLYRTVLHEGLRPDLVQGPAGAHTVAVLARRVRPADPTRRPVPQIDAFTGDFLPGLQSQELPAGQLLVRGGDRRTTRCPSCAVLWNAHAPAL